MRGPLVPHRVLRIPRHETDPVRIILAAHIQLRRWRRAEPGQSPSLVRQRIREIGAARDALIGRTVGHDTVLTQKLLARRSLGRPIGGATGLEDAAGAGHTAVQPPNRTV